MSADRLWDVIVVGGGPGGSTVAAFLAQAGHAVLVLERDPFPRFRIGESLLPVCLLILEELGVEPDPTCYVYKRGAEFVCEQTGRSAVFDFGDALPGPPRHAWHVSRPGFDLQIKQAAEARGATFQHGVVVAGVDFAEERVAVRCRGGETVGARFVIDASGQNRLLARHFSSATPIERFGRTAAFVHFDGVGDEAVEQIGPGHDIRIIMSPHGWGWLIPLPGRRISVGLVSKRDEPAARLLEPYIRDSPMVRSWSRGCTSSDVRLERNFSYRNTVPSGRRYACVGDAACFLDPVFSSGVTLAMVGGRSIAQYLGPALLQGEEGDADLLRPHDAFMEPGIETFEAMIDRFYNTRFVENFIFGPDVRGRIQREIVSVLAGDVWRDDSGFAEMLTRSRRRAAAPTAV